MQIPTTVALYLVSFQRLPESFFGSLLILNAAMVVLLQFPISRRTSRYPVLPVMMLGSEFYRVAFGRYGWMPSVPFFVLGMFLATLGEMLVVPASRAMITLLAPDDARARYGAAGR